jgi:hypothetical protein
VNDIIIQYPLSQETAQELREPVLGVVLDSIKSVTETHDGFVLNFGRESSIIKPVSHMIEIERVLNPFLRMALIVESSQGPIKLELNGPSGTKDFLTKEFGLRRWLS